MKRRTGNCSGFLVDAFVKNAGYSTGDQRSDRFYKFYKLAPTNTNCHTKLLLLLALGIEVNWDFLRFVKQKDVGSGLALHQNFFVHVISALRAFFQNFLEVSKGSSLHFVLFCNRIDVQKIPKGLPSYIFRHYATYRRLQKKFENFLIRVL